MRKIYSKYSLIINVSEVAYINIGEHDDEWCFMSIVFKSGAKETSYLKVSVKEMTQIAGEILELMQK